MKTLNRLCVGVFFGLTMLSSVALADDGGDRGYRGDDRGEDRGGCVNSPENPTIILGLLGAVAAGAPWLRARVKARAAKRTR